MTRTLEELREYLVGEWLFDNDFLDTSGNGNHGTPTDIEWKPTARGLKPYSNNGEVSAPFQTQELSEFTIHINHKSPWTHFKGVFRCEDDSQQDGFNFVTYNSGSSLRYKITLFKDGVDDQIWFSVPYNDVDITKFRTFDIVFKNGSIKHYLNGQFIGEHTSNFNSITTHNEAVIGFVDSYNTDTRFYSTALTDDEVLALYNSTKNAVGVRPAERSFTHRLQPEVDANTVAAFDMSTKNSDGTLMDLSGNSNHGDIYGAARSGGYFTDGMRFANPNLINAGRSESLNIGTSDFIITALYRKTNNDNGVLFINGASIDGVPGIQIYHIDSSRLNFYFDDGSGRINTSIDYDYSKLVFLQAHFDRDGVLNVYINGELVDNSFDLTAKDGDITNGRDTIIIGYSSNGIPCELIYIDLSKSDMGLSDHRPLFNSLATLPLYTFDASKYPTSDGWTTNVPYSSMSISSGEFSFTDDGQLQCDSAGSFTLSNSHPFDADEYIKVKVNGTEYADTGSITQGNVTVSLTQGSNKIDVNMGTGDVIDGIDIQFREPVE